MAAPDQRMRTPSGTGAERLINECEWKQGVSAVRAWGKDAERFMAPPFNNAPPCGCRVRETFLGKGTLANYNPSAEAELACGSKEFDLPLSRFPLRGKAGAGGFPPRRKHAARQPKNAGTPRCGRLPPQEGCRPLVHPPLGYRTDMLLSGTQWLGRLAQVWRAGQ